VTDIFLVFKGVSPELVEPGRSYGVRMNTTQSETADTKAKRRPPRQRAAPAEPRGYARARAAFEGRAQDWLLDRPGRLMVLPDDLPKVVALGVPCRTCGALVYRYGDAGHTISWTRQSVPHWAAAITASCE
jgi:hypothetical protein